GPQGGPKGPPLRTQVGSAAPQDAEADLQVRLNGRRLKSRAPSRPDPEKLPRDIEPQVPVVVVRPAACERGHRGAEPVGEVELEHVTAGLYFDAEDRKSVV